MYADLGSGHMDSESGSSNKKEKHGKPTHYVLRCILGGAYIGNASVCVNNNSHM